MGLIRQHRFAAIDFESAGAVRGRSDHPVQIGLADWSADHGLGEVWGSYLHTDQPVTWAAQRVHGIGLENLADAPSLMSLWPEIRERLGGAVVVAHGKGTEKRFLRVFPGHGFGPWVDTLWLVRAAWPDWPDHSLSVVCERLELVERIRASVPGRTWHDALFDAAASLCILEDLIERWQLADQPLERLLEPELGSYRRGRRR